jgi:FADH2-dependent halogenase
LDLSEYSAAGAKPEDVFGRAVEGSAFVKGRLAGAGRATPLQVTADWSYRNRSFHSRRLVRVGDAAGFVDPIFSSGVLLAMRSAREAALAVDAALRAGDDGAARFAAYQRRVTAALDLYRGMATRFYTRPFVEVFLEPRNKWHVVSAVNAVLAGETDGGWKIRWRLKLFYLIVALQARWPLVPRLRDGSEPS